MTCLYTPETEVGRAQGEEKISRVVGIWPSRRLPGEEEHTADSVGPACQRWKGWRVGLGCAVVESKDGPACVD